MTRFSRGREMLTPDDHRAQASVPLSFRIASPYGGLVCPGQIAQVPVHQPSADLGFGDVDEVLLPGLVHFTHSAEVDETTHPLHRII